MTSDENFTAVRISREALKVLKKYSAIHHLSTPRFLDNLASLLVCGIDGLTEWEIDDLRKQYRYSSLMIARDMRMVMKPTGEE